MNLRNDPILRAVALCGKRTLCLLGFWLATGWVAAATSESSRISASQFANRPLSFERNLGQCGDSAAFIARGPAYFLSLAPTEVRVTLQKVTTPASAGNDNEGGINSRPTAVSYRSLQIELVDANKQATLSGVGALAGRANYFIGNDPTRWRTDVPTYDRVRVTDVYPGINLLHYGNQHHLEYDFELAPGANPRAIALRFSGADKIAVTPDGDLILSLGQDELRQPKPMLYQTVGGRRKEIPGGYVLADAQTVRFAVGNYDRTLPLTIDPVVSYSSYFHGVDDDILWAVAVGPGGDLYLAGETLSAGLATAGAFQTNLAGVLAGHGDVFVARKSNNSSLTDVYITYLGGIAYEAAFGLAVDGAGNAYVTGYTGSTNFPTRSPYQTNLAGQVTSGFTTPPLDCFITKIGPQGTNLVFSTFFGGSQDDVGQGIALDANTNIYVAGQTISTNLPTANTVRTNSGGLEDAFVLKLDAAGTNLLYALYLGGTNRDFARDLAVDLAGNVAVVGYTGSTNFPVTTNAVQTLLNQTTNTSFADDAFIAMLSAGGGTLTYASYLGGTNSDRAIRLATDAAGAVYVTGWTLSGDFPRSSTNFATSVTTNTSAADVFVVKFTPGNTNLDYAVTFGGAGEDEGWDIAVDGAGQAQVVGETASLDFPTNGLVGILRGTNSGGTDAFLGALNSNGTAFLYSAYLGGAQTDRGYGVTVDPAGNAYFIGETIFGTFPTEPAVLGSGTDRDGFVVKLVVVPALAIAAAGTNVELSWPGFTPEFALESRTNLLGTNAWLAVTNASVFTNSRHVVTLPATNAPKYFRLKN